MRQIIFVILSIVLTSCSSDSDYVRQHSWKYGDGFWVGDWLSFDNSTYYGIRNDTLLIQDTARATIIDIDRQLGGDIELTIKSISTSELGTYHEK